jgi:hypothetical protein
MPEQRHALKGMATISRMLKHATEGAFEKEDGNKPRPYGDERKRMCHQWGLWDRLSLPMYGAVVLRTINSGAKK